MAVHPLNDRLARDVFEQPPVLDVILQNLVHEDDTLPMTMLELDLVSLLLVLKCGQSAQAYVSSEILGTYE